MLALLFYCCGTKSEWGILTLISGVLLLILVSIFKGALELAWGVIFPQSSTCTIREFYDLSGGIGCSPVPVAFCYSLIIYGISNMAIRYVRKAS